MCQVLKPMLALVYQSLKQRWELWCSIAMTHQFYYTKLVDLQSSCILIHKTLGPLSWSERDPIAFLHSKGLTKSHNLFQCPPHKVVNPFSMVKDKREIVGLDNMKRRIKISDDIITQRDNMLWVQKEVGEVFFHFYYCEKEGRKESKGVYILIFLCRPKRHLKRVLKLHWHIEIQTMLRLRFGKPPKTCNHGENITIVAIACLFGWKQPGIGPWLT